MPSRLVEDVLEAFRTQGARQARDALGQVVNRAARVIAEGNRRRLTELWKELARAHYEVQALDLNPELREKRGYLEAIVHLTRAVRDLSNDVEATEKVKSCAHGPRILNILRQEGTLRHGDLAQRLRISPSTLTQTMRRLLDSGTVTSTVHGKFKYYSLTPLGRSVTASLARARSLEDVLGDFFTKYVRALKKAGASLHPPRKQEQRRGWEEGESKRIIVVRMRDYWREALRAAVTMPQTEFPMSPVSSGARGMSTELRWPKGASERLTRWENPENELTWTLSKRT